jgi:cytoskeletal protein RodZ
MDAAATAATVPVPHAGIRYAVLRVALLVTVGGVLYLVGMRGWPLLFAAVLASGVMSFFVFARQREAAARNLEASVAARSERRHAHDDPASAAAEQPPSAPADSTATDSTAATTDAPTGSVPEDPEVPPTR